MIYGLYACVLRHGECGSCPYYADSSKLCEASLYATSKLCEANLYADASDLIGSLSDEVANLRMQINTLKGKKA